MWWSCGEWGFEFCYKRNRFRRRSNGRNTTGKHLHHCFVRRVRTGMLYGVCEVLSAARLPTGSATGGGSTTREGRDSQSGLCNAVRVCRHVTLWFELIESIPIEYLASNGEAMVRSSCSSRISLNCSAERCCGLSWRCSTQAHRRRSWATAFGIGGAW